MTVSPVTAYTVTCNACGETLGDDGGGTLFADPASVADAAPAYGWTVFGDRHLCPTEDDAHQAFIDRLMPPEPTFQAPGQLTVDEG